MATAASKVKKAVSTYAKNVAGGASIVGNAVKNAVNSVSKTSQGASVIKAPVKAPAKPTPVSGVLKYTPPKNMTYANEVATPKANMTYANAPKFTPASGVGTKSGGFTYTPTGWASSSVPTGSTLAVNNRVSNNTLSNSPTTTTNLIQSNQSLGESSLGGNNYTSDSQSNPVTNVIGGNQFIKGSPLLPVPEKEIKDFSQDIPTTTPLLTPEEKLKAEADKKEKDYLADLLDDFNKKETGADIDARLQRELGIKQKQEEVNSYQKKLNDIVSRGEANQLSLIGQGRGIPEAIIGGQQAQIARETAIQSLPVQAQLSAAQGNLEMANDSLDRLFKIYSQDAENEFNYKREVKKFVYESATARQKRELDKLDKQEERAYKETQALNEERSVYAKMAFETGQSSLGSKIAQLNYKSPTFKQDLANLTSKIVDTKRQLEIQKLQNDLVNAGTTINPKVLNTTQFKAAQAAQNLKLTLNKAIEAVQKYGNREVISGTGAGILNSLKVQLRSEISTALEQGVVVPGEAAAFDQIAGQINKNFFIRNSKTLSSLRSLSSSMDGRLALQKAALTNTYKVSPSQIDTLLNIIDLSDQEFTDMDALIN